MSNRSKQYTASYHKMNREEEVRTVMKNYWSMTVASTIQHAINHKEFVLSQLSSHLSRYQSLDMHAVIVYSSLIFTIIQDLLINTCLRMTTIEPVTIEPVTIEPVT